MSGTPSTASYLPNVQYGTLSTPWKHWVYSEVKAELEVLHDDTILKILAPLK